MQQSEWWDQVGLQAIADVYETATAWGGVDDVAQDASVTIRCEVQERYGIDVEQPGADAAAVATAIAKAEGDRANAAAERAQAGHELTAAQLLFAQADRFEREAGEADQKGTPDSSVDNKNESFADIEQRHENTQERGLPVYDSVQRRQRFAEALESKGIARETIAARILADRDNATHPREAVNDGAGRTTRVRTKAAVFVQQRGRGGLSR